ncbi:TonB-dependent receptor plug domain-containing protein [Chitinimonas arctica]|uniref:TonB-dependent receptor plug domain-containing protein n=1 Tax=Chitinimonas arctica TaxID=2594795 RepID=UPI001CC59A33|nr:TonB-dependent receptor [Chitinimonas arctica]
MKKNSGYSLTAVALAIATLSQHAQAADTDDNPTEKVVITGSRIARASQEGPTSVTVITAEDLEKKGYKNVFDALNSQTQSTGFVQGADYGNTFTPAANAVSLRGLGANHTLVLLNGRRVADYPIAYEGSINFVDLANIPSALIDRIEILNGGASAIYGSDAIAGVVNVILKKQASGVDVDLKVGTTQRGGGSNARVQISGGAEFGKLSAIFAAEISRRDAIWSKDRDFMADTTLHGAAPTSVLSRKNVDNGRYIDLGDSCQRMAGHFGNSLVRVNGSKGAYCASGQASPSFWTTQTENHSENLFGGLNYAVNERTNLFGELALGFNTTRNNTRGPSWTSEAAGNGYFFNRDSGRNEVWSKRFSPEEIGGATRFNRQWDDSAASLAVGVRGDIAASSWNYEASYSASSYVSKDNRPRLLKAIDSYFLGPKLGEDADGVAIYAPDAARFTQPITPAQFDQLAGASRSKDKAWTQTLSISGSGELLALPAGPLKLAAVAELGSQGFRNQPDERINQGVYYNSANAQITSGSRSRYALGAEFNLPLHQQLNATLAGRYDHYSFAGRKDSKLTYNAGLEYRPAKSLLLRGNYATSFRAPDMNYIYAAKTRGYYASSTDYYRCKLSGQPLADCEFANQSPGANYIQTGSKELRSENGKSYGYGVVWSPASSFDISADYWNIRIKDLVTNLDADTILRDEADCRTGVQDAGSVLCLDALARVHRNPANAVFEPNAIREVMVNPINAANERTSGVDLTGKWRWKKAGWGSFLVQASYTRVLSHHYRQFSKDPETDQLKSMQNSNWPSKLNGSLGWTGESWRTTLQLDRYGRIPNGDQSGRLSPYVLANWSASYQFGKNGSVGVIVNNVLDKVRLDPSGGWPFYPVGSYSPHGRQAWLQLSYHFGS